MEEERPVHVTVDMATGKSASVPITDEEWDAQKQRERDAIALEEKQRAEEKELEDAIRNHDDPVVKALGKKLGLI